MRKFDNLFKIILTHSVVRGLCNTRHRNICQVPAAVYNITRVSTLATCAATMARISSMSDWSYSDSKLSSLPLDPETQNYVRQVPGAVFSCVQPTPWSTPPELVSHSQEALELLDLDSKVTQTQEFLDWVAGNKVLTGSIPMAHR